MQRILFLVSICISVLSQTASETIKYCYKNDKPIESKLTVIPELLLAPVNSTISMSCASCSDKSFNLNLRWFKKIVYDSTVKEIKQINNNPRIFITPKNELIIKYVSIEDSGFYYCQEYPPEKYPDELVYYLDVLQDTPLKIGGRDDIQQLQNKILNLNKDFEEDNRFIAFIKWKMEQSCTIRETTKTVKESLGSCVIKMVNPGTDRNIETFYEPYKLQLSCHSAVLKRYFSSIFDTSNEIPDFVLVEKCCEGNDCTEANSIVIEILLFEHDNIVLPCVGSNMNSNITWHKDLTKFSKDDYSAHRIIDKFNALHLVDVRPKEKGLYFCKVDGSVFQQFHVVIKRTSKMSIEDLVNHLVYLAYFFFISLSCYFSCLLKVFVDTKPRRDVSMNS